MHVRQQVRNFISNKIREIPELKKSTIESRVYPLGAEDLPAALVFTENETVEQGTKQHRCPAVQKRFIETAIYVFARANKELENEIDVLCEKIENKIFEDQTLGQIALKTTLSDTRLMIGGDPDAPTGAARMSFISVVYTEQGQSDKPFANKGGVFQ